MPFKMILVIIFKEYLTRISFNVDARFRMFKGAIKPITAKTLTAKREQVIEN
jgi:hypothetical protein